MAHENQGPLETLVATGLLAQRATRTHRLGKARQDASGRVPVDAGIRDGLHAIGPWRKIQDGKGGKRNKSGVGSACPYTSGLPPLRLGSFWFPATRLLSIITPDTRIEPPASFMPRTKSGVRRAAAGLAGESRDGCMAQARRSSRVPSH
jgi:hypothetical protein